MREIKFRAWRIKSELMQFNVQNVIPTVLDPGGSFSDYIQSDDVILMQYTGLKDKNGVEIYESDLVLTKEYPYPFEIYYRNESCQFCLISSNDHIELTAFSNVNRNYFEVIGNIHENPELLKGERYV